MSSAALPSVKRLRLAIRGAVQGVGFRPFIYRLATELGLKGWVNNSTQGVFIEVEGAPADLESFLLRVEAEKPPRSFILSLESSWLDAAGYAGFEIRESEAGGDKTALVLPDIATCPDCLREIFDPNNRRHFYPFTNCTNCGPRFSIIESLPYDRANTSMKRFTMCSQCQAEYDDPLNRRFHAQPNACAICGPQLALWDQDGHARKDLNHNQAVLAAAAEALRTGKTVAVKGLGGFHLMVSARDDEAVARLRELKHREEKPFALMFPSVEAIRALCEVSRLEERLIRSPEAPIVLLRRHHASRLAPHTPALSSSIAPGNPSLGVMLPYTPLHHLLLSLVGFPVVATSGNLSDEPICTDEREACERLAGIGDFFLVHDRPIVRHVDDSIARVMAGRELVVRRARGYAPLPIRISANLVRGPSADVQNSETEALPPVLAVGAHLKNTIALSVGPQVFISQHIGDLETVPAFEAFRRIIADFERLYEVHPAIIAADAHPDYLSTQFARDCAQPASIQHHIAHVFSCMAENELAPPVLGVSWDGTGYGLDGTVWGGEFFLCTESGCDRVAHFRQFQLPGGEAAVKEPRRAALGLLYEMLGPGVFARRDLPTLDAFSTADLPSLKTMLARGLNCPATSSVGRLFDAIASIVGHRHQVHFEGQAAMELEFALDGVETCETYPLTIAKPTDPQPGHQPLAAPESQVPGSAPLILDWSPMVRAIIADLEGEVAVGEISARFHNTLAESIVTIAKQAGQQRVVLSGGCFQNRYLTECAIRRLQDEGFHPYWHQRVPPNDGGIALGQIAAALRGNRVRRFVAGAAAAV